MNKRGIPYPAILLMILALGGVQALNAQDAPDNGGRDEPVSLTGSATRVADILSICDNVFVGQITEVGIPSGGAEQGWTVYSGVGVDVAENLRGTVESQIKVCLQTLTSAGIRESAPKYDASYIFFVYKTRDGSADPYTVIKLVPATDGTIAMVKGVLSKESLAQAP